jgi:hypothetical protein
VNQETRVQEKPSEQYQPKAYLFITRAASVREAHRLAKELSGLNRWVSDPEAPQCEVHRGVRWTAIMRTIPKQGKPEILVVAAALDPIDSHLKELMSHTDTSQADQYYKDGHAVKAGHDGLP